MSNKWTKEYRREYMKDWRNRNIDKYRKYQKEYQNKWKKENAQYIKEYSERWAKDNPEKNKNYLKKHNKKRLKRIDYKISNTIRFAVWLSLKNKKAGRGWESLLGYTVIDLMKHLEGQFENWMNWNNYGEWEIDHIKPISSFSFTSVEDEDFRKCWALNNLRPLEKSKNRKKYNKIYV